MVLSFADEPTADLFREWNTRAARRVLRGLWPVVQRKLKMLDVASQLEDLLVPPGNRLERLKGRQADRYSIRLDDRYRITFQWTQGHAYEVRVEDCHSGPKLAWPGGRAGRDVARGVPEADGPGAGRSREASRHLAEPTE